MVKERNRASELTKKRNIQRYNLIIGFISLTIAFYSCIESIQLGFGQLNSPDAGFFPFLSSISLGLLSTLLILGVIIKKDSTQSKEQMDVIWPAGINKRKIIITLLALIAYAILLDYFGYFLSTFLFCALF